MANGERQQRQTETVKHTFSGAAAGLVTAIVVCPLDVVKVRQQNQQIGVSRGTLASLAAISRAEGLAGLFAGLHPTGEPPPYLFNSGQSSRFSLTGQSGFPAMN